VDRCESHGDFPLSIRENSVLYKSSEKKRALALIIVPLITLAEHLFKENWFLCWIDVRLLGTDTANEIQILIYDFNIRFQREHYD